MIRLRPVLAARADAIEQDIMAADGKAMRILDRLFQIGDVIHFDIKQAAAAQSSGMVMLVAAMIVAVRAARHKNLADYALLRQLVQIAIHRSLADAWML